MSGAEGNGVFDDPLFSRSRIKDRIIETQLRVSVPEHQRSGGWWGLRAPECRRLAARACCRRAARWPRPRLPRLLPGGQGAALPGGAVAGAKGREGAKFPENQRREELRRGRGTRAPSACCRRAAGAGGGGVCFTTWTLPTCGPSSPESSSGSGWPGTSPLSQ